jgi:hypothetical protein
MRLKNQKANRVGWLRDPSSIKNLTDVQQLGV